MKKRAMILTAVLTAAVLAGGGYFPTDIGNRLTQTVSAAKKDSDKKDDTSESEGSVLDQATLMYQQYNYDEAIKLLKQQDDFDTNKDYMDLAAKCQVAKSTLVEYPLEQITHVFFHTLIDDTGRAFDGDSKSGNYNQVMTTVSEFSYYHYMDGDGCASKLVLDENGEVKNEYVEADGSVSVGDYDLVPLLDTFIKEHPDFSYHGRKGILAMTGYNGVLGYRTDIAYKTGENLQDDQKKFLEDNPDFDYDQDVADATKVADAMKAEGWEFASHTWGHMNATERSAEDLKTDDQKWKSYVAPILGDTDMIIFAFGADIGDWSGYSSDNPKFQYYKSAGYDYFCNVDSSQYFVQITDQYFRQGRRNLDGYRMYYNPEMLSDLFDVADVWDSSRPTPVPQM